MTIPYAMQLMRLLLKVQDQIDCHQPIKWQTAKAMMIEIVKLRRLNASSERKVLILERKIERLELHRSSCAEGTASHEGDIVRRQGESVDTING